MHNNSVGISYKSTVRACYLGTVCLAVVANLTALIFTVLGEQFGLSFTQLGALVMVYFLVQVFVALIFGPIVDRVGFRPFIVGAHVLAVVGMAWFAATPWFPFDPYAMMMIGTLTFGIAGGFLELLTSPILNAIPTDEKSSAMSIMHAFYCFGHVAVVFGTTLFLAIFGRESWQYIFFLWLLLPLVNGILFTLCPIEQAIPVKKQSSVKEALRTPLFIVMIFMIVFAGASELTFSQWTSAFMEEAMGLPKVVGDIAGIGTFAIMMGLGRIGYGLLKQKNVAWLPEQSRLMLIGTVMATLSYVIMANTYNPVFGFVACAICGLGVSLLWPGTLSLAVDAFPNAGTWMFAVMAAGGTIGASMGPSAFGVIADVGGLRSGFMIMTVVPLGALFTMMLYHKLIAR